MINLTPAQLRKAADLQEKIAKLQTQVEAILGSETKAQPTKRVKRGRKKMSAAEKAKVSARMKAYWKARKAGKK